MEIRQKSVKNKELLYDTRPLATPSGTALSIKSQRHQYSACTSSFSFLLFWLCASHPRASARQSVHTRYIVVLLQNRAKSVSTKVGKLPPDF